mmetsp:Transcript_33731/g.96942  ORF Transcript_33731/g.96942 Transcript_33731/m.96942 type:complete len:233 (-) Transcript_33731:247-945(-)
MAHFHVSARQPQLALQLLQPHHDDMTPARGRPSWRSYGHDSWPRGQGHRTCMVLASSSRYCVPRPSCRCFWPGSWGKCEFALSSARAGLEPLPLLRPLPLSNVPLLFALVAQSAGVKHGWKSAHQTVLSWPWSVRRHSPVVALQSLAVKSSDVVITHAPSGENAAKWSQLSWLLSVRMHSLVAASQSLAVQSPDAVTTKVLSGEKRALSTEPVCPANSRWHWQVAAFHIIAV